MKKLPKTQEDLLQAIKNGVKCRFMPYMGSFRPNAYYFRNDTMSHCTAAARALLKKGLVQVANKNYTGHELVYVAQLLGKETEK